MSDEQPPPAKDPVKLLQEFLDREGITLTAVTEAVQVGDGSMLVRPKITAAFRQS